MTLRRKWVDGLRWWHRKSGDVSLNLIMEMGHTETYAFGANANFWFLPCQFACCGRYYHFWNFSFGLRFLNANVWFHFERHGLWLKAFEFDSGAWYRNIKGEVEYDEDYERKSRPLWEISYCPKKGWVNELKEIQNEDRKA